MPISPVRSAAPSFSSRNLSVGARGQDVADLQADLAAAGYAVGPIDGDFGPMTRAAVLQFQRDHGLDVDGVVGPQTLGALGGAGPAAVAAPAQAGSVGQPVLRRGAQGSAVTQLQRLLAAAGCNPGPVDGSFGPMTDAAVRRFQATHGCDVDGVVGPQTWGALGGSSFTAGPVAAPSSPGASDFRRSILAIAQAEVGTVEATNNNDGDVTKYPGYFGRGQQSYCADFASWVLTHAGGSLNNAWCPSIRNLLIQSGNWKGKTDPQPGDLVLFDWDSDGVADHVGLVKSVNGNGTLTTIEGNTGGPGGREGVWEKTRGWDTVLGFGNPI